MMARSVTKRFLQNSISVLKTIAVREQPLSHRAVLGISCYQKNGKRHQSTLSSTQSKMDNSPLTELKERGLYIDEIFQHVKDSNPKSISLENNGKFVNIVWGDNTKSSFNALWLRHHCHCKDCRLDFNGMVKIDFNQVDLNVRVVQAIPQDGILLIKWESETGEKEHCGMIPLAYLKLNDYSEESNIRRKAANAMKFHKNKIIPEVEYSEVQASEEGIYKWMKNLSDYGVCCLKNVPLEKGKVAEVAEHIAPLQHTVYGETFDVVTTPKPINAAYSKVHLSGHMDQIHYESPPGLQLLHCLQFDKSITGGENTFLDIHEAAEQLRKEKPDYFNTLATIPFTYATFHYARDYPVHLKLKRTIFTLNKDGDLRAVMWHPMLCGALNIPERDIEKFYEAYKYFYGKITKSDDVYKIRMVPGDCITFNNRRVLHSRTGFENQEGWRHLQGTYVEISEYQSRLQVFHNKYGDGRLAVHSGSLDLD